MGAFEDFVNTELPLRTNISLLPAASRFARFTGVGRTVEARTAAQVLADIAAAASAHSHGDSEIDNLPLTGGDVTTSGAVATIGANKVTLGMMATLDDERLIGNVAGAAQTPAALSKSTVLTFLGGTTGTGAVVLATGPTIASPVIANFLSAQHNHEIGSTGGTLSTDAITSGTFFGARLAVKHKTYHHVIEINNPADGNVFTVFATLDALTIRKVYSFGVGVTNQRWNLEIRDITTPETSASGIFTTANAYAVAAVGHTDHTSEVDVQIAANSHLKYVGVAGGSSDLTKIVIHLFYTIDD